MYTIWPAALIFISRLKGLAQAKIIKKSVILFWLPNLLINTIVVVSGVRVNISNVLELKYRVKGNPTLTAPPPPLVANQFKDFVYKHG